MVKQQCLFGTLLSIKVPGRHFLALLYFIVDIETLRICSKNLVSSVNEVVKIHEQGTAKRVKAQEELVKIEEELKQAMLDSKYRK